MTLFRTVKPALEPVSLADAKSHLRVGHDSEDSLLVELIAAAREEVERQTGLSLIEQDWRLSLDALPPDGIVVLKRHPVREILSVTIYDADGGAFILPSATYVADLMSRPARLALSNYPRPGRKMNGIEIDFRTGFGATGVDVPDLLRRAILMLTGHWYEFRSAVAPSAQPVSWPAGFERLIAGYRRGRL